MELGQLAQLVQLVQMLNLTHQDHVRPKPHEVRLDPFEKRKRALGPYDLPERVEAVGVPRGLACDGAAVREQTRFLVQVLLEEYV